MGVDPWTLGEFSTMDASVWSYHENIEDLKYKLMCATMELDTCRTSTKEELCKRGETISQLMQIVKVLTRERDEAKQQMQLIQQWFGQPNSTENCATHSQLLNDSPPMRQIRAGSSITESDNLSGTPNCRSYSSSPVESFFNPVNSPEFSSKNIADSCNVLHQQQPQQTKVPENKVITSTSGVSDPASALIDSLVPKKPLPEKGRLLQSVLEAGPLLQTLMLAGALPQWCNPPPLHAFHIPPLAFKPFDFNEAVALKPSNLSHRSNGLPHIHAEAVSPHPGPTGLLPVKRCMNASLFSSHVDTGKRQRYE